MIKSISAILLIAICFRLTQSGFAYNNLLVPFQHFLFVVSLFLQKVQLGLSARDPSYCRDIDSSNARIFYTTNEYIIERQRGDDDSYLITYLL